MSELRPVQFVWMMVDVCDPDSGEVRAAHAMVPLPRFVQLATRQYEVGEQYAMGPVENIPGRSRAPLFIAVKEAWNNLPEDDKRFPSDEHLRKRALVAAGWAHHTQHVLDTVADAIKVVEGFRKLDAYAVIKRSENVVDVWIAKSIGAGAITAEDWKVVKQRALDFVAEVANTTRTELEKHVKQGGAL